MQSESVESKKDLTTSKGKDGLVETWTRELENASGNEKEKKWRDEAKKYFDIYTDQHNSQNSDSRRYNVFWSNTQTLRPLTFSKLPKPNITQRFLDKDEISRVASEMMERSISLALSEGDADIVIGKSRDDFLIGGRGVARVVFDPDETYEIDVKIIGENGEETTEKQTEIDSSTKKCRLEYVDWKDFRMSTEKEWSKVRWVAFRHYKTRAQLVEDFGEQGKNVSLNVTRLDGIDEKNRPENELFKMAEVWEIWDKDSKSVYWMTAGGDGVLLGNDEDPYSLKGFFPMPKPLGSESDPSCLTPVPLYRMYKSQAEELNQIDTRIKNLIEQCKATGIYSSTAEGSDMEALFNGEDGQFTPIRSTSATQNVKDLVTFKPIQEIVTTIISLNDRKDRVINSIRDITGISDIVRGVSVASETATAQQLKGNFAISRIQPIQKEIEFWVRDLIRLLVELKVENYSISELAQMTNLQVVDIDRIAAVAQQKLKNLLQEAQGLINPQDPEAAQKMQQLQAQAQEGYKKTLKKPLEDLKGYAVTPDQLQQLDKLIKNDKLRVFSIDVETDSTVRIDQQQEKQDRVEYVTAISNFASSFFPMVQGGIITADAFNQFLIFISKPFKVGRNVEESLISQDEQEPKQPTPQEMLAQAEMEIKQQQLQLQQQELQINASQNQQKIDIDKAKVKIGMQQFDDKLEFDDVNKQADRDAKRLEQLVKARTEIVNNQIREANKPTQI